MIIIQNKQQASFSVPRNPDYSGAFDLSIYSPVGLWSREYYVVDDASSKNFYKFTLDFRTIPDGEFNYTLTQEGETAATGIIQIGNKTSEDYYIQYPFSIEYIQYYTDKESYIILNTEEHLPETASAITFSVVSNVPWTLKVFHRHHTETAWTEWYEESHREHIYDGTIDIGPQVTDYPRHYKIVAATNDGKASEEKEITQDAHYYFNVDVFSPYETIPASAAELSYGIQYSEYNSNHTGTFYIYKNDVLIKEQPFGWYPYGFSTYMLIEENETDEPITYEIVGILDNGQNDRCIVTQQAAEPTFLIMSATSYSLRAEDTSLSWSWASNKNWTMTATTPWGTATSQYPSGSGSPIFYFEQNTTHSARTFTYQGQTSDGQVTTAITFTQAASIDYSTKRFTIEMLEDGDINWEGVSVYYNLNPDGGPDQGGQVDHGIPGLKAGDIVEFYVLDVVSGYYDGKALTATGKHNVYGNIMSIVYPDFEGRDIAWAVLFRGLFRNNTNLVSAENLILPSSAETSTYERMFEGCTSLTTAPELPQTALTEYVYDYMFDGCSSLNYIKCYATSFYHAGSTENWLRNVAPTGDFWRMSSTEWESGNSGIPNGWTSHNIDR